MKKILFLILVLSLLFFSVGIYKVSGKPQVKCPNDFERESGEEAYIEFEVQNLGESSAVFGFSLEPGSLVTTREIFSGKETKTIGATLSHVTDKDIKIDYVFTAYDLNNPDIKDSCSFEGNWKPFVGCTPGSMLCSNDGKKLLTCKSDGKGYLEKECKYGCEAYKDTFRCRLGEEPTKKFDWKWILIIGLITGIILLFLIKNKIKLKKQ